MPHHEFRLLIPALLVLGGCASPNFFSGLTWRNKPASTSAEQAKGSDNQATEGSPQSTWTAQAGAPDGRANTWSNPYANRSSAELLAESEHSRRTGNLTSARLACEQAIRSNPFDLDAKYQLARISDDEGRFAEAERIYLGLLNEKPGDSAVLTSLGWSYYLQGRFEESERRLQESLAQQPQNQVALNDLGFVYGARGNLDTAWDCFRAAGTEAQAQEAMAMLTQNSGNIPASGERSNAAPGRDPRFESLPPSPAAVRQADARAAAKVPETQYPTPQAKKLAEDFQKLKAENDKQLQQRRAKQDAQKISAPSPWNNNRQVSGGAQSRDSGNYPPAGAQDRTVPYGYGAPAANPGMTRPSYGDSGPAGAPRNGAAFPGASYSQANRPGNAETGNFGPGNAAPNNYAPPSQAGLPPGAAQGPQMGLGTQTIYEQPRTGNQRPQLPIITPGPGRDDSASTNAGYNQSLNSLPQDNSFTPLPSSGNVAADYRIPEWPGGPAARGQTDRTNQSNQVQPASGQQQYVAPGRGRSSSLDAQAAAAQVGLSAGPGSMGIPTGDWSTQTNGLVPPGGSAQQNFNRQGQGGVLPAVNYWSQTPAGGATAQQPQGQQSQMNQQPPTGQSSGMGASQGAQSGDAYPMPGRPLSYPSVAPAVVPSAQGRVYGAGDASPLTGSYPGGINTSPPPARSSQ